MAAADSHGVTGSTEDIGDNVVITVYGVGGALDLSGGLLRELYKCLIAMLYT